MIKNFEELRAAQEASAAMLNARFSGADGKKAILLCCDSGCMSAEAGEIRANFKKLVAEKHLEDKVTVHSGDCFGLCSQGPFVKVFPEDVLYCCVTPADVDEILEKHIKGGEIVDRLLYVDPVTKEKIAKEADIAFYKKQMKVALHGVGKINPEDINEALGVGAFEGLARALQMDRKAVIDEVLASGLRGRGGAGFPTGRKWSFA